MTQTLSILLSIHVLIGVIGVMASYMTVIWLFKKNIPICSLKVSSLIAFIAYIITWITGGYYYVVYYGSNVKPIIKEGPTPWVHSVIMEAKEHIFLFLPALSFVVLLTLWLKGDRLKENKRLCNTLALVALITFIIAISMALGGIVISGAAR
ncbi:MAG: hypothetical protein QGH85_02750 [Candidatus Pacebacteria bacterium]|jgi:hypothetical protein|nr:hypothetical protein [Parcubacteria group bacterium]MDP6249355.1 hypothetical protein [Candidatus Paceibacterota bacterium]MDP7159440.1 hypothetical protein [Candidatus Paceibacterota bacterium]MDP7366740.1 hypothetical protein [Candidatus Paceibacterota bacterium]MDP7466515.1 hypothetical protein [Candidatus Paceibacterota bacterium]|tara:strand:- start:1928 stop:2383 length:456 start_codon:yes stop_codon:yes gene_type:complete